MPPARRAADAPPGVYATQAPPSLDERQHWQFARPSSSQSGEASAPQLVRSRGHALPATDVEMRAAQTKQQQQQQQQAAGPSQPAPPRLLYQIRLEQQQQQEQHQQRQQEHERLQHHEQQHARRYELEQQRRREEEHHAARQQAAYEHSRRQHEQQQQQQRGGEPHAAPRPYGMVGAGSPEEAFGASAPLFPLRREPHLHHHHNKADAPLPGSTSLPQMHPAHAQQAMHSPADERRLPSQFGPVGRERRVRTLSGATSSRLPASLDGTRGSGAVVHERLRSAVSDETREPSLHAAERPLSRSADSDWELRYMPAEGAHSPAEHRPAMPSMLRDVRPLDDGGGREPMQGHHVSTERGPAAAMHASPSNSRGASFPGPPPGASAAMSSRSISSSSMGHTSAATSLHGYADEYGASSPMPFARPRALTAAEKRRGNSAASQSRRMAHLMSEQRRREHINQGFEELRSCVPTCGDGVESKATILRRAIEYIGNLEELVRRQGGNPNSLPMVKREAHSVSPPMQSPAMAAARSAPPAPYLSMAGAQLDAEMSSAANMHDQSPALDSRHLAWSPKYGGGVRDVPRMGAHHRPAEHGERGGERGGALGLSLAPQQQHQHYAARSSGTASDFLPRKLNESASSDSGDDAERRSDGSKHDASPASPSHRFTHGAHSVQSLLAQPPRQASH